MKIETEWVWPTPVMVTELDLASALPELDVGTGADDGLLRELGARFSGSTAIEWTVTHHEMHRGDYRSPSYSAADIRAYLFLEREQRAEYDGSGSLVLFDPRAGIQNVFVPGMPWNRSVSMRAEPGRFAATLGWVPSMITPLGDGERLSFACIEGRAHPQ